MIFYHSVMDQEQEPQATPEQQQWKAPKFKESLKISPQFQAAIRQQEEKQALADQMRADEVRRTIGLPVAETQVNQNPTDKFAFEVTPLIETSDDARFHTQTKQLVHVKVSELNRQAMQRNEIDPASINANHEKMSLDGFIGPGTRVKRSSMTEGFFMNDQTPYEELIATLRELKAQSPDQSARALLTQGVYREVSKYFGNWTADANTEALNRNFYSEEQDKSQVDPGYTTSISQLRGQNIGTCGEKAALAHNLFLFSGMKSNLVYGKIGQEDHAYNILTTERGRFLVDVTNPVITTKDGRSGFGPSIYPITEEQMVGLGEGQPIEVTHVDYEIDDNNQYVPRETKLAYS